MAKLSKENLDAIRRKRHEYACDLTIGELLDHIAELEQEAERKWTWARYESHWVAFRNVDDRSEVFRNGRWVEDIGDSEWPSCYPSLAALTAAVEAAERGPVYEARKRNPATYVAIKTTNGKEEALMSHGWENAVNFYPHLFFVTEESAIEFGKHYDELREKAGANVQA